MLNYKGIKLLEQELRECLKRDIFTDLNTAINFFKELINSNPKAKEVMNGLSDIFFFEIEGKYTMHGESVSVSFVEDDFRRDEKNRSVLQKYENEELKLTVVEDRGFFYTTILHKDKGLDEKVFESKSYERALEVAFQLLPQWNPK